MILKILDVLAIPITTTLKVVYGLFLHPTGKLASLGFALSSQQANFCVASLLKGALAASQPIAQLLGFCHHRGLFPTLRNSLTNQLMNTVFFLYY